MNCTPRVMLFEALDYALSCLGLYSFMPKTMHFESLDKVLSCPKLCALNLWTIFFHAQSYVIDAI